MIKKMIAGLQWIDNQLSAPGFKTGACAGAAVTAAVAVTLAVVL